MQFASTTADRVTAGVLFLLGLSMAWGGWTMDRLEIRQIHPASIPGLVPMILGVILMICAVLLFLSARQTQAAERAEAEATPGETTDPGNWRDFGVTAGWSCIYALLLVGTLPFALATAIYVLVFVAWFGWRPGEPGAARLKRGLFLLVYSVVFALAVSALFRYGFLVRLP
jgi:putative tricarboxylic transport membrane protein